MRNLKHLEKYRQPMMGMMGDEYNGMFELQLKSCGVWFKVIASNGLDWDHISVSTEARCPRWEEMHLIKQMFFENDEIAIEIHPSEEEYVNMHPYCLHMWRSQKLEIPMPPKFMV